MRCRDLQKLPCELIRLMESQVESLGKETSVGLSDTERREYEQRQDRIDELCEDLCYLHPVV